MKHLFLAVLAVCLCIQTATAQSTESVQFTCYDFHPDFPDMTFGNNGVIYNRLSPGAVTFYLQDGNPVFANKSEPDFPFTNAENFNMWYRSTPGVNQRVDISVPFTHVGNRFVFSDNSFFPLDNLGFGNEGFPHNYFFTCKARFYFQYTPDCTWSLSSDDDLWVYVNGIQVADLGGLHQSGNSLTFVPASVVQTAVTNALGVPLVPGQYYPIDIFYAERMVTEAALNIDICNGVAVPPIPATPPPITPPPIPIPGGTGDPHIRGFLGQKFDFHGDADKVFNVISDHDLQLNSKIVGADLAPDFKGKTYFGAFGIKIGSDKLFIACDRALEEDDKRRSTGHILELNGQSIADSVKRQFELDSFNLRLNEKRHRLTVEHDVYTFNIQFSSSARSSCHLNIRTSIRSQKSIQQSSKRMDSNHLCPHGVLGQTVRPTPMDTSDGRNGEGVIEGVYTSYHVRGDRIFGDDFEFNCFKPEFNVLVGEGISDDQEK